jgi:hypothetical protein
MKKTIVSLVSLSFIVLSACNPVGTSGPSKPNSNPINSANPNPNSGGTTSFISKQDYIKLIDCIISKLPNNDLAIKSLEMAKQQVIAIPDSTWNTTVGTFLTTVENWKKAYSTLGCF